jgi:hypothetical protein
LKKFAVLAAFAVMAFPAAASAHSVQDAAASCTAASASLVDFGQVDTNIRVSVLEGTKVLAGPVSVASPAGTQVVPVGFSALSQGDHELTVRVEWNHGESPQVQDKKVKVKGCPAPPVVTPTPTIITLPGQTVTVPSAPVVQTVQAPVSAPVVLTPKRRPMKCERRFNKRHQLVIVCTSKKPVKANKRGPAVKHAKKPGTVTNPSLTG